MTLTRQTYVVLNFSSWEGFNRSVWDCVVSVYGDIVDGKHFIGLVTIVFTAAVIPLFRLISQNESSYRSKAADAGVYVMMNIFGIGIIVYPWWLATAKSPLYYSRLQTCGKVVGGTVLILAGVQGIFEPERPFEKNNPDATSLTFKIISSLNFAAIFIGLLVVLPVFIRRERLFKSNSHSIFRFAWVFTAIMLAGLLIRRWTGYTRIVSFSCLFLVVQFFVLNYVEEIERNAAGKVGLFDEAYIIIAGKGCTSPVVSSVDNTPMASYMYRFCAVLAGVDSGLHAVGDREPIGGCRYEPAVSLYCKPNLVRWCKLHSEKVRYDGAIYIIAVHCCLPCLTLT
jgi:hypothetical protein